MSLFGVSLVWTAALLAALCALAAFWRARYWKRRAKREAAVRREALQAMAFEAANAVNAIRANLLDFRQANPAAGVSEHLEEIERSAVRIAAAVHIADDPAAWSERRNGRRPSSRSH
jgi:hypothetical protein